MSPISPQIQEIIDRAAILDTVVAYARALDTKDWETLAALFTDDARWEYTATGDKLDGPTAIVARIRPSLERLDTTQHFNSNHVITVHEDAAEHTCYYHAQHIRRGLPDGEFFVAGGSYHDRLRRTTNGWRFVSRRLSSSWSDGNPDVLA
ncbi:nuclear transport factor 2 family protein [Nocardia vinacea]|uniref:nuclear transport factor 2 family protein n=1 Tax=Nocardia vinacea TaxID=96468 RepID=UPI002E0E23E8|nr:nuclear transport factor 2 family protein [Nocardia vinacea]